MFANSEGRVPAPLLLEVEHTRVPTSAINVCSLQRKHDPMLYQLQQPRTLRRPTFVADLSHVTTLQHFVSRPLTCGADGHQQGMSAVHKYTATKNTSPHSHGRAHWPRPLLAMCTRRDLQRPRRAPASMLSWTCSHCHSPTATLSVWDERII